MKKLSTYLISASLFLSLSFTLTAQDWTKYDWDDVVDGDGLSNNFGSDEAIRIAENVLLYQRNVGGWPKNTQMQLILTDTQKAALIAAKPSMEGGYCTIDNNAVELELEYLSKVYKAIPDGPFREEVKAGFLLGVQYLLDMQYENGGWPQFYPLRGGYSDHITYNDGAMIHAMNILRHIYQKDSEYSIIAADSTCAAAKIAFEKGIEVILKTQIVQNGVLTAWCAQHHYETLAPAKARSYELPAIWGGESSGVVRFLMSINNPSFEIKRAIHSAATWFDKVRMIGQDIVNYTNADGISDRKIIYASNAGDMWARCYSLENSTPFFCDRNGIPLYTHYDYNVVLSHERRNGYSWFGGSGEDVLDDYPGWVAKWGAGMDEGVILESPGNLTGYAESDSVIVKVYANTLVSGGVEKFELYLDQQVIRDYASLEIDTVFTGLGSRKTYCIS